MGKRNKVTTRDIAERLKLSQSTVSMILSDKEGVSFKEETVSLVKDTAKEMGYVKPFKREKSKKQILKNTILVVCPDISNVYYSTIIQNIVDQGRELGYTVVSACTFRNKESEHKYLELIQDLSLAGIIFLYAPSSFKSLNTLALKIPVIFIGDKPSFCHFDSVDLNNVKPAYILGDYLISLGHEKIAYVSPPISKRELGRKRRLDGIRKSFTDHKIPLEQLYVFESKKRIFKEYPVEKANYLNGYNLTSNILEDHLEVSAFIGYNDMTAFGIMASIIDHGYKIPNDFSVCGFDNTTLSSLPQFSLTTVDHAVIEKGQEAVKIIDRKNKSKNFSNTDYVIRLEYEPQLIIRKSTAQKKNRGEDDSRRTSKRS